ncbi:MAG TPA: outer membrane beta-barrel protein [Xanthobacteraceae bacterium]|nr:outer membrane beta-barrel protein [Xanthobacteraceae bacterium]
MTKSRVVTAAFVAVSIASPAFAADLLKAPAAPLAVPSWSGFYIGGEVGGKWVTDDWTSPCIQQSGNDGFACGGSNHNVVGQFPGAPDSSATFKTSGLRAGVYLGAMTQIAPQWVLGIEGDYAFYKQSASVTGLVGCETLGCRGILAASRFTTALDSTGVTNKDDFSIRPRLGFLVTPDIMLYGTGGLAFQRVEASMACGGVVGSPAKSSVACHSFELSQTDGSWRPGWTVGGGVELKLANIGLPNWLLRGEYRYSDFGTWKPNFFQGSGVIEVFPNIKVTSQIATAGLAYKF